MISYEICMGLVILPVSLISGSFNFIDIINYQINNCWLIFPLFPSAILFFIIILAETNRAPFDLPEAEAELVAGYNIEYGSVFFALFFLGEYNNIVIISSIFSILYLGGYSVPCFIFINNSIILETLFFFLKTVFICFLFILVRSLLPRYRYDQLMQIC
jgi:NADH-quinone oxidoreductase subunit H